MRAIHELKSKRVPFSTSYLQLAHAHARNSRVKKRMTFRDRLKKKAIKTQNMSNWNEFRKVKNQLNQEMKAAYYTTTPLTNILVTSA